MSVRTNGGAGQFKSNLREDASFRGSAATARTAELSACCNGGNPGPDRRARQLCGPACRGEKGSGLIMRAPDEFGGPLRQSDSPSQAEISKTASHAVRQTCLSKRPLPCEMTAPVLTETPTEVS